MKEKINRKIALGIAAALCAAAAIPSAVLFARSATDESGMKTTWKGVYGNGAFTAFAETDLSDGGGAAAEDAVYSMKTMGKYSTDEQYLLLATNLDIEDYSAYKEVGYSISADGASAEDRGSNQYYDGIIFQTEDGPQTVTMQEIFPDNVVTGMIVCEIEYDLAVEYSVRPYYISKEDVRTEGDAFTIASRAINDLPYDDSGWTVYDDFYMHAAPESNVLSPSVEVSSGVAAVSGRPNDPGKYYPLGQLDGFKGRSITCRVKSSADAIVGLYMELGQLKNQNTFRDWLDLTVNGEAYISDSLMPAGDNYKPSNEFTFIGYIPLREGENEIVFTVNTAETFTAHNVYGLKFTAESAEIAWASELSEPNQFFPATAGPLSQELAEGVTTAAGTSATNIATNRPNHADDPENSYYPIGNLNANIGASVTFTVNASQAETAGLYAEFCLRCDRRYTFDQVFSLEVNGQPVACSVNMPYVAGGTTFAPSNMYTFLGEIELQAGENTITFTTIANNSFNIYGIAFESSVVLTRGAA